MVAFEALMWSSRVDLEGESRVGGYWKGAAEERQEYTGVSVHSGP